MRRLFAFLGLILLFSCEKNTAKMPIVGKWKMVEAYFDTPQSCFCWIQLSSMNPDILVLTATGNYKTNQLGTASSLAPPCPGRYRFINDSTIGMTSDCRGTNPGPVTIGIYSQTLKHLTIEYHYPTQEVIKHKYIKL